MATINLLPEDYKQNRCSVLKVVLVLVILLIIIYLLYSEKAQTKPAIKVSNAINNSSTLTEYEVQVWRQFKILQAQRKLSYTLLQHLFSAKLHQLYYTQLEFKDNQLTLIGKTQSHKNVHKLLENLAKVDYLQQPVLKAMRFEEENYHFIVHASGAISPTDIPDESVEVMAGNLLKASQRLEHINHLDIIKKISMLSDMNHATIINLTTLPDVKDSNLHIESFNLDISAKPIHIINFINALSASTQIIYLSQWKMPFKDNQLHLTSQLKSYRHTAEINKSKLIELFKNHKGYEDELQFFQYIGIASSEQNIFATTSSSSDPKEPTKIKKMPKTDIKFLGTMQKEQQTIGLIADNNGKIHSLKIGHFLPNSRSVVSIINRESMTYIESEQQPSGSWVTREKTLFLKKP